MPLIAMANVVLFRLGQELQLPLDQFLNKKAPTEVIFKGIVATILLPSSTTTAVGLLLPSRALMTQRMLFESPFGEQQVRSGSMCIVRYEATRYSDFSERSKVSV
jgi:hypothetical protein